MKSFRAVSAALMVLGVAMTGPATAMPQASAPATSGDLVVKVQVDCHASVRRHYLPEYDRRVWHRHRQSNCRVIVVDPENDDYEDRPRDCHRDVRRHYLRQYGGEITHKHIGESCRVRTYSRYPGDRPGGDTCIRLGIITYCEN